MPKIMIADDSMFARLLLKEAVSQIYDNAEYIEAKSGQEVLDKFAEGLQVDWYLLDVNMGEPNGLETAETLIEQGVDVNQIALVTGNKSSELQSKADDIDLNYINKALSPTDVEPFVERLRLFFSAKSGEL
ncbi:response regulator transcription factor [Agaribacter flavus]|uniref:Response regulator transcription factor n=1 Tax=Agaribacter flavus TaxID=1902781 RepID=A0ABV7FNA9_9ALTE